MSPDPPAVIFSHSKEEAEEKLKQFNLQYPDGPAPIVYVIIGDLDKPANAGLSKLYP